MTDFKNVPLSEIKPDPNQPRQYYDDVAMQELTDSIREKGVLQPILIRPNGKGYIIVCGERRYRASLSVNTAFKDRNSIPAVIRELSDEEALELQIIENLQRKDVHPMEEAVAFKSLIDKGKDIKEVAARVGKSEFYARQRLKLNSLIKDWQKAFYAGRISISEALKLVLFDDNTPSQRSSTPSIQFNTKTGLFNINKGACERIGLVDEDQVIFLQDEKTAEDWYIEKVKTGGFVLREKENIGKGLVFNSTTLSRKIYDSLGYVGTGGGG